MIFLFPFLILFAFLFPRLFHVLFMLGLFGLLWIIAGIADRWPG